MGNEIKLTKRDIVKLSYGINWDKLKDHIDSNGYIKTYFVKKILGFMPSDYEFISSIYCRIKTLSGFEYNNGWKKIEFTSDLPKEIGYYWGFDVCCGISKVHLENITTAFFTHYQIFSELNPKPNPPIY